MRSVVQVAMPAPKKSVSSVHTGQPIASAPKDGTRIIATWNPEIYGKPAERMMPDPIIVRWISDHYKGEGWYDDYGGTPMHVTHWMPLPAPPTEKE